MTPPIITVGAALVNGWVDFGAGYEPASYWRGADQVVHLCGVVKTGTIGLAIFTLPAGYRPANVNYFAVDSNTAHGRVYVDAAGVVNCDVGNNTYVSLCGISFRAAP